MSSREFLNFLERSLDYVSLDLVGMSLIILKKPYAGTKIRLKENDLEEVEGKIDGTMWMESKADSSIRVSIKARGSPKFNIETDLAKSFYKYYYRDDEEFPALVHVQTVLSDAFEKLDKSKYLDALSIIRTI
jgi:hypothetical protein